MGLDPNVRDQELVAEALERRGETLTPLERRAEGIVGGAFVLVVAALLLAFPPQADAFHVASAAACLGALVFALRAEFDIGSGFTVPSQLAFVPLLFALPPALVPVAVVAASVLAYIPDVVRGEMRPIRLLRFLGSAWFAVGPSAVLAATETTRVDTAAPAVLVAALAAQLLCDLGASAAAERLVHGAGLREQLREGWVYAVDLALTPLGLLLAWQTEDAAWAALALVPLLAVLSTFGRERRGRITSLVELNRAYRGVALVLGDVVEADDGYTGEHSRGVVALAMAAGERLGLDPQRMRNLEFGALLHDVGKVAIPKEIINKPGNLDAGEWELVKTHTLVGQAMLDRVGGFMSDVGLIVRSHHERWDGGGYPDGLAGEAIPLEARIVAACDTWNAMTTDRSYRPALPFAVAEAEMRECAGTQLDPRVVAAVLAALPATGMTGAAPARERARA